MPEGDFSLVDARGRKYLTSEERGRFLAAARAQARPAVQTFVTTLAHTGCRISEALAIDPHDIDLEAVEPRLRTVKRRRAYRRAVPAPGLSHVRPSNVPRTTLDRQ